MLRACAWLPLAMMFLIAPAIGGVVRVELPDGVHAKAADAQSSARGPQLAGRIGAQEVTFENLKAGNTYSLRIELSDGVILQGVDLAWYNEEPENPSAAPMTDQDHKEVETIVSGLQPFMNKSRIVQLKGNHDRAVVLCEFVRDKGFVNDKGGEIIWRAEIWYFKFQAGEWEAVSQANKVLRRERFRSRSAFEQATQKLVWTPELGGIHAPAGTEPLVIRLRAATNPH